MTAATMQPTTPAVPPRPPRASDKNAMASMPAVPPRPINKRLDRSVSPNPSRFAPSPLHEGIINKSPNKNRHFGPARPADEIPDPMERPSSVSLPMVGEEGMEYSQFAADQSDKETSGSGSRANSPEQTRLVGQELKLHAPKPSLPAMSAKHQVMAVTRTDSDRAASFGIGRPRSGQGEQPAMGGHHKRPSTTFSVASDSGHQTDEEHGIHEIGQRVPMNPNVGDVQAPSPAPGAQRPHHNRKHSGRGLPPGSYGLHGHGVTPMDKLEKAYYQKHPELVEKEHHVPIHERSEHAMSSADLNRLVRDTASRASLRGEPCYVALIFVAYLLSIGSDAYGTPTDEVAFKASDHYVTRSSSRPASAGPLSPAGTPSFRAEILGPDGEETIHVDDPKHPEYRSYGDEEPAQDDEDHEYNAPILASDEVAKNSSPYVQQPAVHPPPERRGSTFEMDEDIGRSRPSSRPASLYNNHSQDFGSSMLEDVEEYEPLFDEEEEQKRKAEQKRQKAEELRARHHFPSKDIWEDAPSSVHYTATVSSPQLSEDSRRKSEDDSRPMTPAQAFAQHQEQLAEKESRGRDIHQKEKYAPKGVTEEKPTWAGHQSHLQVERPRNNRRFPSRDIWEDVPESQLHVTTITPKEETEKPDVPTRPVKKHSDPLDRPVVPSRPKPKSSSVDDVKAPSPVDRPKPQIPTRPAKKASDPSQDLDAPKSKPAVPSRPVGSKIAAMQAGFMSDLNKRLQIGPREPKKEESPEREAAEEKEKVPLSDARRGRARGPQRRAPAKAAPATTSSATPVPPAAVLSFTTTLTNWSIHPDDDSSMVELGKDNSEAPAAVEPTEPTVADDAVELVDERKASSPETEDKTEHPSPETEGEALEKHEEAQKAGALEEHSELIEDTAAVVAEPKPSEDDAPESQSAEPAKSDEPSKVEETLVHNMAGEGVLEATTEKNDDGEDETVKVEDTVKS